MDHTHFEVDIDHCDVRTSRAGGVYVSFNVFIRSGDCGFLSCNWRFQEGVLYSPYRMLAAGKFFTHTYVSEAMAKAIYDQIYADLQSTPGAPEMPWVENGWKAAVYYPQHFRKMMPDYYEKIKVAEEKSKAEGRVRSLRISRAEKPAEPEISESNENAKMFEQAAMSDYERRKELFIKGVH